jgi:pimeloyl-ACP methyl ester carboxylesterase
MVICGVCATLFGCTWLDTKQRELVLRPTPGRPSDFVGLRPADSMYLVDVPGEAGRADHVQLWWMPNADLHAPTLLYLHGTFRNLFQNVRKIEALRDAGFSVVAVEYRGWGESSPLLPSEASIEADAATGWAELMRHQPDPHKRVIFGHSMGTAVAVDLASRLHVGADYGGLILESSFTRLPDVAKAAGVLGTIASWFATQEFDAVDEIGHVDAPILMMHGEADATVPIALGRRLFEAAPKGTVWVPFPGGSHSGLDQEDPQAYRAAVQGLIQRLR